MRKVYGDFGTTSEDLEKVTEDVKELSRAMAELGFTAKETIGVASEAAAIGFVGDELTGIVKDASELAALGMMTQEQALNTLVSVNSAFQVSVEDLGKEIDFLNAVENETILSMQDMSEAIPITAAAIQGLGGDVRDLAVFMTAMREGGINANESANALKTSLARLITPTKQATETANQFGISIENIVAANEGDLMQMVQDLAKAMENLSDLQQQQLLSDLFGKRQFARMGALFNNLNRELSQAQKTMKLTEMSAEDLAQVTAGELSELKESPVMKLTKAMEQLQLALVPVGEMFAELLIPVLEFGVAVAEKFGGMSEVAKKVVVGLGVALAVIAPAITMLIGLMGNFVGQFLNAISAIMRFFGTLKYGRGMMDMYNAELTEELTLTQQTTAAENAKTQAIQAQTVALNTLIQTYQRLAATRTMPGGGAAPPLRMATGGRVPGSGNTDKIPALLTPGEFVVNKSQSQKHSSFLNALNNGSVKGFAKGGSTQLTHTQAGSRMVFMTSDEGADAALQERITLRQQELELTKQITAEEVKAGKISQQAAENRLARVKDEERAIENMKTDWAEIKANQQFFGGTGTMEVNSNAVAGFSTEMNQKIKSTGAGVSGSQAAAFMRGTPGAYDFVATASLYDDALQDNIAVVRERAAAGRRLTERMAQVADQMPADVAIVDDITNTRAEDGKQVVALGEIERQAQEELIAEQRQELALMEQDNDIDEQIIVQKRKELEAQTRLATQMEQESKRMAESRKGLSTQGPATAAQLSNREKFAAASSSGRATVQMPGGKRTRTSTTAGSAATKGARMGRAGMYYSSADIDPNLAASTMFSPQQITAMETKAREAGTRIANVFATAVREGFDEAMRAGNYVGDAAIEGLQQGTESQSPSRAAARVGADVDEGLALGMIQNQGEVKAAATQVGDQLELDLDMAIDGERIGRDTMDEVTVGAKQRGKMSKTQMGAMGMGALTMGASSLAMMAPEGGIGGVGKGQIMSVGMTTGMIASFAAMLGPAGVAIGALAIAAGAAYLGLEALNAVAEKQAEEGYEAGKSLGGVADAANTMAKVFGKATAIQKQNNIKFADDEQEAAGEFAAALGSEGGKALVEELSGEFGQARIDKTAQLIETAIVNGMIEADQADTFAKALAQELGDQRLAQQVALQMNNEGSRTQGAVRIAEKRDRAIREDGSVNTQTASGVGKVIATSMNALNDWTTVAAVAKDEYQAGTIAYEEYIAALNQATEAQNTYAESLQGAVGTDTGANTYATQKILERSLKDAGVSDEALADVSERLREGLIEQFNEDDKKVFTDGFNDFTAELFSGLNDRLGLSNPTDDDKISARELQDAENEAIGQFAVLYGILGDVNEAQAITLELQDDTSEAYRIYNRVLKDTTDQTAALNATMATLAMTGNATFRQPGVQDAFASGIANSSNAQLFSQLFSEGMTEAQIIKQLQFASGDVSYITGGKNGPAGERVVNAAGAGLNAKQRDQYANAMGDVAAIIGPEMQEELTDYVAEGIENGVVDGGTEGIQALNDIFGDQEVVNAYIKFALEDGELSAGEIKEIAEQLRYIKAEIPPDMMINFGIDINNPEHFDRLSDPAVVDQLSLVGKTIDGLPDEEKQLAARFAFDVESNGEPKTAKEFIKGWKEVQKAIAELEGMPIDQQRTALIDIITELNGKQVDPSVVNSAVDQLIATYGAGTVTNLAPTVLTTAVDLQIDAAEAIQAQSDLVGVIASQGGDTTQALKDLEALEKLHSDKIANVVAPQAFNAPASSSGGGGGGDKNYLEQLEKLKLNNEVMNRLKQLANYNKKQSKHQEDKRRSHANLAETRSLQGLYEWKYNARQVNEMYFDLMKDNARQETKGMRKSSRREQEVKYAKELSYFTKQQLLSDEKLLEMYEKGDDFREIAINQARRRADIETTQLDIYERQAEEQRGINSLIEDGLELRIKEAEYMAEGGVFGAAGTDRAAVEQRQAEIAATINRIQLESIEPMKDKIEAEKRLIKEMEREYEINEDNIDALKDQVDERQRMVEDMQRALEIRQREGEMLDHDLKLMGYMEEEINEVYDARIDALDKTLSINQQIAQSQKDQLGLANALSSGDVSAAAAAAQQMQQNQMGAAADQFRAQLENSRDSQIASLTGQDSGLTREQIEQRQRELEEDSYYTNLAIRDIEDDIYNLNRQIRDEQDVIDSYKDSIKENNKVIRDLEWQIYEAEQAQLKTLQDEEKANKLLLAQAQEAVAYAARDDKIQLARFKRDEAMWEAETDFRIAQGKLAEELGIALKNNNLQMQTSVKLANEYYKALSGGGGSALSLPELAKVNFDQFAFKAKDLSKLNADLNGRTASYNIPVTGVGTVGVNGIMGGSSNFMNNNVNVNATGASAEQVAAIVIQKLEIEKLRNIGGQ